MEVDHGRGAKESPKERPRAGARAREVAPAHVFCAKVFTGPAIVLHTMVAKASVLFRLAFFQQAQLEGDRYDWITGAVLLQSLLRQCKFSPVLTSTESSFSTLEPQCPW